MSAALSPIAQEILNGVRAAMQDAEELGGPEGDDYAALMDAIAAEATVRKQAFNLARGAA